MTTATTTAAVTFARTSTSNSLAENKKIVAANASLFEKQNSDAAELLKFLEENGRDSQGSLKQGFMGSLLDYVTKYGYLSEKQTASLRKIAQERSTQKELVSNSKSKFLGKVGETLKMELVLDRKIKKFNPNPKFGWDAVRFFYIMSDSQGNRVVYSGTSSRMARMEEGKIYSMEAVVKDHYSRSDENQTYIAAPAASPKEIAKFDGRKRSRKTTKKATK